VKLPNKDLFIKGVPKGTADSPENRRFIMVNHLCCPTYSVKSFRHDFDYDAVELAGLDSKSEWTIKKKIDVLVPLSHNA